MENGKLEPGINKVEEFDDGTFSTTFVCSKCGPQNDSAGNFPNMAEAACFYAECADYDVVNSLCWQCSKEGQDHLEMIRILAPDLFDRPAQREASLGGVQGNLGQCQGAPGRPKSKGKAGKRGQDRAK